MFESLHFAFESLVNQFCKIKYIDSADPHTLSFHLATFCIVYFVVVGIGGDNKVDVVIVQLLGHVQLFVTP